MVLPFTQAIIPPHLHLINLIPLIRALIPIPLPPLHPITLLLPILLPLILLLLPPPIIPLPHRPVQFDPRSQPQPHSPQEQCFSRQ